MIFHWPEVTLVLFIRTLLVATPDHVTQPNFHGKAMCRGNGDLPIVPRPEVAQ